MTTKKLKILGPYTPEHPGPFCTRDGVPVDLKIRDGRGNTPLKGYMGEREYLSYWIETGQFDKTGMSDTEYDLMNAEEVPVAREFWVNEYKNFWGQLHGTHDEASRQGVGTGYIRTIHVREVLPGDGE